MFSQYSKDPFTIEQIEVVRPDGTSAFYPQVAPLGGLWVIHYHLDFGWIC